MFSGIVAALGRITKMDPREGGMRLAVSAARLGLDDVAIGDSIAVNGVCLTVVAKTATAFEADVSGETLACTTGLDAAGEVNLEKALRLADRLDKISLERGPNQREHQTGKTGPAAHIQQSRCLPSGTCAGRHGRTIADRQNLHRHGTGGGTVPGRGSMSIQPCSADSACSPPTSSCTSSVTRPRSVW